MIGIIDYNAGNIKSVERALSFLGIEYVLSKNPSDLKNADKIIFPGVGDADFAMKELKKSGFDIFIKDFAATGLPLLGICLGSQIIFESSEEGNTACLGLVKGTVKHFSSVLPEEAGKLKIPHMGWSSVSILPDCPILKGIPSDSDFYFVHSYIIQPEDLSVVKGFADYGLKVPAVIQSGNIFACQFHPEKSAEKGLAILKNFSELSKTEAAHA